jgi:dinuclear metal center YbgI/SA1388 family protein
MSTISEIIRFIEEKYPPQIQESYDNSGLIVGRAEMQVKGILLTIDVDEDVVEEAIEKKCNFILAHHPIIFHPLKKITGADRIERTIIKAIKNDIAIYGAHTSVDLSIEGINGLIAEKLEIKNLEIIEPKKEILNKIVVFVPKNYAEQVRNAIFEAGAGYIGKYDMCSYNVLGEGTFRALEGTNPFVGEIGKMHTEKEIRIETIFPDFLKNRVLQAMKKTHPYEEIAYDIYKLENKQNKFGAGVIGDLAQATSEIEFLEKIKEQLNVKCLKHSALLNKKIKKIAICSGGCSFLLDKVLSLKADVFIASEFRYDQYIKAKGKIIIVDAGHYETEILIKNLFYNILTKNFTNFAVEFSESFRNPVKIL